MKTKMQFIRAMIWGLNGVLLVLTLAFSYGRFFPSAKDHTQDLPNPLGNFPIADPGKSDGEGYDVISAVPNPMKKAPPLKPPEDPPLILSAVLKIVAVDVNARSPEKSSVLFKVQDKEFARAGIGGAIVDGDGKVVTLTREYKVIEIYKDRVVFKYKDGSRSVIYIDNPAGGAGLSRPSAPSEQDEADKLYQQGLAREENFNFEEASEFYNKLIELRPNSPEAYLARGRIKRRAIDFAGAIADLDRAIELNPNAWDAYAFRAVAKYWGGDREGALADADKALAMNPYNAEVYFIRAYARRDLGGSAQDVERDLEMSRSVNPLVTAKDHFDLATTYLMSLNFKDGLATYDTVIRLSPNFSSAYGNRGWCKYHLGDYEGAIADYNRAMEITPAFQDKAKQLIEMARARMQAQNR